MRFIKVRDGDIINLEHVVLVKRLWLRDPKEVEKFYAMVTLDVREKPLHHIACEQDPAMYRERDSNPLANAQFMRGRPGEKITEVSKGQIELVISQDDYERLSAALEGL